MIKDIDIRSLANDASYTRGCRYYENGAVMHLQKKQFEDGYTAKVHGNSLYGVDIELMGDRVKSYACECPAADLYPGACKHVVAVLKAIQHEQRLDSEGRQRAGSGKR